MTIGVSPARVDAQDVDKARHALAENGAVVLTGLPATADDLATAAACLYGQALRQLFPMRERVSRDGGPVHLHADSFDQVVDVGGVPVRRRDPDEDAVLVQCVRSTRSDWSRPAEVLTATRLREVYEGDAHVGRDDLGHLAIT